MTFTKFIKRPVLSTVISILLVLLGIIGLTSLPIEQYPDIAPPTIMVRTSYQGADAETVMKSVVVPLEESINGVENMTYMTSSATNDGMAMITVYFKQGSDADMAAVNVQNRVQQAQALLPAEVTRVGVTVTKRQTSNVIMYAVTSDDGRYDDQFVTNYNDINIVPLIKRVNGVGDVQSPSTATYSMRIWLQPDKMKQYGLIPSDITGVLAEQNIEAAPGKFGENSNMAYEYTLRYKGRLSTPIEYQNIVIQSKTTGETLHLKDVAKIELGSLMYNVHLDNDGQPACMGMVQQTAGSNATQIATDVKAALADAQKSMPPGLKVVMMYDVYRLPLRVYRGGYHDALHHLDTRVLRGVHLPARLALDAHSHDRRACGLDRYVLLPADIRILHQPADAVGVAARHRHRGGRCHRGGRGRARQA